MRALDATTSRCNLRPTVEITRGPFTCPRRTALLIAATLFAAGFTTAVYTVLLITSSK